MSVKVAACFSSKAQKQTETTKGKTKQKQFITVLLINNKNIFI